MLNKKIKVLQFPIANSYGGITHYALENWKWIDKTKFQMDFATMSKSLDFAPEILESGSKIHYISCYAEEDSKQFSLEINKILDEGYDVVHLHTKQWKSFLVEQICKERNVHKVIVHSHSTQCEVSDKELRKREIDEHYRVRNKFDSSYATDFWACSEGAAEWLFGGVIPSKDIHIMNNAIDVKKFLYNPKKREELRRQYGVYNMFVIGNVGRMSYSKNHLFLIDVFAEICNEMENVVLVLVGDGELRGTIEKHINELGIKEKVLMLGKRSDTYDLYQMMDLFVAPSIFEGLPITTIEAQAAGLKCIDSVNVTKEANITGNVEYCHLKKETWKREIIKNICSYDRKNLYCELKNAGYDIETQIKVIEKEYSK